jgi:hypothetical protein
MLAVAATPERPVTLYVARNSRLNISVAAPMALILSAVSTETSGARCGPLSTAGTRKYV